jgi:hypothetical protein
LRVLYSFSVELTNCILQVRQNFLCLFKSLPFEVGDRKLVFVDTLLCHSSLVHRYVSDFLQQQTFVLVHLRFGAVVVIKWSQVVLVLHVRVVHMHKTVLFVLLDKLCFSCSPLIAALLLEDRFELFLRIFGLVKRRSLIHTFFSNSSPASEDNIEVAIGIV